MLPTVHVFGKTIAMYGLLIIIGIFFGLTVAIIRRKKYNITSDDIIFSSCYAGLGLLIGSKLLYIITIIPDIITYWEQILAKPSLLLSVISGGFVFYGGLFGALIGYYFYCKQYHINLITLLELLAPSIPLIHAFGRIGCYFAGCCYGIHYDGPFHIIFQNSIVAPNNISLFPIQLVEAALNFTLSIILLLYASKKRKAGQTLGIYFICYSVIRFILEYFRGDVARGILLGVSTSQWISLALIPIGLIFLHYIPYILKD